MAIGTRAAARSDRSPRRRRQATALEAKALAHPLRVGTLSLAARQTLSNNNSATCWASTRDLALPRHRLTEAGLMQRNPVRAGAGGALEDRIGRRVVMVI